MSDDYYAALGVERTATADDIKRAYRRLAHQHHPDKASGDEEKFKKINAAYEVLGDEQKRAQYDRFGNTFDGGAPFGSGGFNVNVEDFGPFADIFGDFFGGSTRRSQGRRRGSDILAPATRNRLLAPVLAARRVRAIDNTIHGDLNSPSAAASSKAATGRDRGTVRARSRSHRAGADARPL